MKKPHVVLIAGPTGVGKTAASVYLAKKLGTEIISCDSMQIYRGMDIGTAKVTPEEMQGVVHHMIDIINPDEPFSVCDYVNMASGIIEDLYAKGKVPIIAGGTGLYADSLLKGITFESEAPVDADYRQKMQEICDTKGCDYLHSLLCRVDSESAENIHPNNVKRVIRALEYHHATGEKISDYNKRTLEIEPPYTADRIYFTRLRENLYDRIDRRVDIMLKDGLENEVRSIIAKYPAEDTTAMQALGYKEMLSFIKGEISLEEATELIKKGSRHYAKRQLTWFKREPSAVWLNLDDYSSPEQTAEACFEIIRRKL